MDLRTEEPRIANRYALQSTVGHLEMSWEGTGIWEGSLFSNAEWVQGAYDKKA